ncbi:hypothetical protein UCE_03159 [Enterococcus faecalis EnGen0239]|uniref:DUF1642 domain-containing protein n=1 Tax=Enterococcus faecalis TaxID=1351 RepID=UPI000330E6B7|nr:DUF1642 domain-containing protein [Enterococcus faecalis]EKC6612349.1 DUF1642 domain-containing protein [Enterococcus faecalis]EKC7769802.1 DUF1642 domain-containing protein [Enterococcus faecalis]EKY7981996.1 DUF1642 domain-containing protein [Enterococcus faecalis]EOL50830.1 hypothetical protein UCE_03159 [Enterococcus faecalis EnGen0239]HAP2961196.1 DUF1642 domain-containing protein [Enterococcus faecalis]
MNKQELIEKYKTKYAEEPKDWRLPSVNASRQALYSNFINDLEKLDEPKKVIFSHEEKFVADWLNDLRGQISNVKLNSGAVFMTFIGRQLERYYDEEYSFLTEKIESWLTVPKNKVRLFNAIDNGYEFEKEPLYYVKLPDLRHSSSGNVYGLKKIVNGEIRVGVFDKQEIGKTKDSQLTEQEIKAIDKRYLAFAVKVEEAE